MVKDFKEKFLKEKQKQKEQDTAKKDIKENVFIKKYEDKAKRESSKVAFVEYMTSELSITLADAFEYARKISGKQMVKDIKDKDWDIVLSGVLRNSKDNIIKKIEEGKK